MFVNTCLILLIVTLTHVALIIFPQLDPPPKNVKFEYLKKKLSLLTGHFGQAVSISRCKKFPIIPRCSTITFENLHVLLGNF